MQLIEVQNLLELSKQHGRPCSEQEVLHWLLPVIDVLQELHSRNPAVIHRDIKPGNIILTPQATAVLVDFGLTRLYDPNSDTHTIVRAVSEGFSPIEQYVGRTSPQSDIYSIAATMYYLLTQTVLPASVHRGYHDESLAPNASCFYRPGAASSCLSRLSNIASRPESGIAPSGGANLQGIAQSV